MGIEKIYFDPALSRNQLQKKFNIPKTTAFDARKRGYIAIRTKPINVVKKNFDYKEAKSASEYIFFKEILPKYACAQNRLDDLRQEALLRCFELSGFATEGKRFNYYCKVALYAMYSYLAREHLVGTWSGREVSFEEHILGTGIYT